MHGGEGVGAVNAVADGGRHQTGRLEPLDGVVGDQAGFTHGLAEGRQAGVPAGAEERFPGGWGPGGVGDPDRGHPHGGAVGGPGAAGGSRFGARAQFLQGGLRGRTQEIQGAAVDHVLLPVHEGLS